MLLRPLVLLTLTTAATSLTGASGAFAQGAGGGVGHTGFQPPVPARPAPPPNPPAPPALPGTASQQPAAPARQSPNDLSPTDALFDAIDRGDMAAARDAMARGADANAANVLGMTPLEMSVDLGRNDITFLLLSLRGASPSGRAAVVGAAPGAGKQSASSGPAGTRGAGSTRVTAAVAAVRPLPARPEQARPKVHYAGGESTAANPQAGFLGFGATAQP